MNHVYSSISVQIYSDEDFVYLIGQAIGRGRKQGDFDKLSVDFQQTFSSTHEQVVDFDAFLFWKDRVNFKILGHVR